MALLLILTNKKIEIVLGNQHHNGTKAILINCHSTDGTTDANMLSLSEDNDTNHFAPLSVREKL